MGRALHDITDFTMGDMAACSYALRQTAKGASSMEDVAERVVRYLYDHLTRPKTQETPLALVRLFKSHPYEQLDSELQEVARKILGGKPKSPGMKCWTLLATMGTKPEWQLRKLSKRHKVIPFASQEFVARLPMLSNMVSQFGLEIPDVVLEPDPTLLADLSERTFNVFYVPEVAASSYVPSQEEFVRPNGIRSCLGFGGMLPSGNVFAVIMFSTVPIPRQTASMFKSVSLSVKMALLPFESKVFELP